MSSDRLDEQLAMLRERSASVAAKRARQWAAMQQHIPELAALMPAFKSAFGSMCVTVWVGPPGSRKEVA